eukprot:6850934-Alexandrium_andersonii.AAC.1
MSCLRRFSILSFNVLSLRAVGRIDDIVTRASGHALLCLQGTRECQDEHGITCTRNGSFTHYKFGYAKKGGNAHAGCSILVNERFCRPQDVYEIRQPSDPALIG